MFTLSAVGGPLIIITVVYMGTLGYRIGTRVLAGRGEVDLVGIDSETRSEDEGQRRSADAQTESTQTGASRSGEKGGLGGSRATLVEDAVPTGAVHWRMPFSLGALVLMIVGFSPGLADIATVAMVGALILIAPGCLPFKEALKRI